MELGYNGVRVNAVFPGAVNTVMNDTNRAPTVESTVKVATRPIQRFAEPEEIARASLFLVSDDASYLCGAELAVDGGMTLGAYDRKSVVWGKGVSVRVECGGGG